MTEPLSELAAFADAGVLGDAEIAATEAAARLFPGLSSQALLAYALAVRAPIWGHVCVDLATVADTVTIDDPTIELAWPPLAEWLRELESCHLVRSISDPERIGLKRWPLVLDGTRLYTDRYATYEAMVARAILSRTGAIRPSGHLDGQLDRLFSADPEDKQRQAAALALTGRITVVLGGPGTGKTRTVARLLAAAAGQTLQSGRSLEIALTAPTGKAAARMTEAVRKELGDPTVSEQATELLASIEATTIHRLLGYAGTHRFRHDRANPLPYDLVIVDETSMVSLPLMARLFDALSPEARMVLVGDPYQLASVEAGAVLGDLSRDSESSALAPHTVVLDRIHRFKLDSGIAALADAIKAGNPDEVFRLLNDESLTDIELIDPGDTSAMTWVRSRTAEAANRVIDLAKEGLAQRALEANSQIKVLSAARLGPLGVGDWTERISDSIASAKRDSDKYDEWYVGRPVMATQNDYVNGVFNGDVGVVVEEDGAKFVALPAPNGVRLVPVARMASVATWWAMTIHKSQGSEFSEVILSLPGAESRIMTRELLYTGITRSRDRVTIIASEESLRTATTRLVQRASGLSSRLSVTSPDTIRDRS